MHEQKKIAAPQSAGEKRARILAADDDKFYLKIYSDLIAELGHDCLTADNGLEVLEKASAYQPDIIIIDVVMPGMNGFEVANRLKQDPLTMHIPVLIVTSLSDRESKVKGLAKGADELLSKPIDESEFRIRVNNLLKVKKYEDFLVEHGKALEGEVNSKTIQLEKAFDKVKRGYIETVYRLTLAAEYRDEETGGHIKRISLYSQLLARYLGLNEQKVEAVFFASPMHDIGKIGIPDSILLKPGSHTPEETAVMRTHTIIGANILKESDSEILQTAHDIALSHHEAWDGTGYPKALKGEEIPLPARIVNIVDIYDALRSKRPYKESFGHENSCAVVEKLRPRFDPVIYEAFLACASEFDRLFEENRHDFHGQLF